MARYTSQALVIICIYIGLSRSQGTGLHCVSPVPLSSVTGAGTYRFPFTLFGNTTSNTSTACGFYSRNNAYYSLPNLLSGMSVVVTTCQGAAVDTVLTVFNADCTAELACNDDFFGCGLQSSATFVSSGPATFRLGSYNGRSQFAQGNVTITVSVPNTTAPVVGSLCGNPIPLTIGNTPGAVQLVSFDTTSALPASQYLTCPIFKGLWYQISGVPAGRNVSISTCNLATFDTKLAAYSACAGSALNCNDDTTGCSLRSLIVVTVPAGGSFLVNLGGFSQSSYGAGNFSITVGTVAPPSPPPPIPPPPPPPAVPGDECAAAVALPLNIACGYQYQADVHGSDVSTTTSTTASGCCNSCSGVPGVNAYTWNMVTENCYCKSVSASAIPSYSPQGVYGTINNSPRGVINNTYAFNTSLATTSARSTCGTIGYDIWYVLTNIPRNHTVSVSTCGGATWDTILAAYPSCLASYTACNDDYCRLQSYITFQSTGSDMYVRLGGHVSNRGAGTMTITVTPPATIAAPGATCASATDLTLDGGMDKTWIYNYSTVQAGSSGTPNTCSSNIYNDIWYRVNAPFPVGTLITVSTCRLASFDTMIAVYDQCGNATSVYCNDDGGCGLQSMVRFNVTSQLTPFYVRIGGFNYASGVAQFSIASGSGGPPPPPPPPAGPGDSCSSPLTFQYTADGTRKIAFNTTTFNPSTELASCVSVGNDIFWRLTGIPSGKMVSISTCNGTSGRTATFDTVLVLYRSCLDSTYFDCSDDAPGCSAGSSLSIIADGNDYILRLGGFASNFGAGTVSITVDLSHITEGQECAKPTSLPQIGSLGYYSVPFDTSSSLDSLTPAVPTSCTSEQLSRDLWWSIPNIPNGRWLTVSTCNIDRYDSVLVAYSSCSDRAVTACNDDGCNCDSNGRNCRQQSFISFQVTGPVILRLGGISGQYAAGNLNVQVSSVRQYPPQAPSPPPPPASPISGYDCPSAALLTMFSGESSRQRFNLSNHVKSSAATTCGQNAQADYWFLVSGLPAGDQVFFSVCKRGQMQTAVTVYSSCGGNQLACFTFNPSDPDCESKKDSFTSNGNNFFVRVGGVRYGSNTADYLYYQVGYPFSTSTSSSSGSPVSTSTSTTGSSPSSNNDNHSSTDHPVLVGFLVVLGLIVVGGVIGGVVYWKKFRQASPYRLADDDDNSVGVY